MLAYTLRRLLGAIPTLLILIALAFFMIRAAPGGPFDTERNLLPEIEANLRAVYHLDEPLYQQFGRYLWGLLQFDFGPSFQYRDFTVTELILAGFPVSLTLGASAIIVALLFGVTAGSVAALRQNGAVDHGVMAVSIRRRRVCQSLHADSSLLWRRELGRRIMCLGVLLGPEHHMDDTAVAGPQP